MRSLPRGALVALAGLAWLLSACATDGIAEKDRLSDGPAGLSPALPEGEGPFSGRGTLPCEGRSIGVGYIVPAAPRGTLYIVHGYGASSRAFQSLAAAVVAAGFSVILVDLPGHGSSGGEPGVIGDMAEYGAALAAARLSFGDSTRFPGPTLAFGHSLGAIAVYEALRAKASFEGLVLAMPLSRTRLWLPSRVGSTVARIFGDSVPDGSGGRISLRWFSALAAWNRGLPRAAGIELPALVLTGGMDSVVDRRHALATYRRLLPDARFTEVPGVGHHDPEAAASAAFYARYIVEFASGLAAP